MSSQSAAQPISLAQGDAADPSPALDRMPSAPSTRGAGEDLTHGQKVALLRKSYTDWSRAVLAELRKRGELDDTDEDFRSLVPFGLAYVNERGYLRLTRAGSRKTRLVCMELGRALGLHAIDYTTGGSYGRVAGAQCICGWSAHRSMVIPSYLTLIRKDAAFHLRHVGAKP